jgi:hypothetical protein
MEDSFFRQLTDKEENIFRQWARDNFSPGMLVKSIWHPVVKDELAKLQKAHDSKQGSK